MLETEGQMRGRRCKRSKRNHASISHRNDVLIKEETMALRCSPGSTNVTGAQANRGKECYPSIDSVSHWQ